MLLLLLYHTHITTSVLQWVNNTHARTHHLRDGQATHRKRATTLRAFKHRESAIRTTSAMNIWTGPRCIERDVSSFDTERAFKPEALKKRNFHDKENLGRSMRRNNHRPLPTLATLNPNSLFGGITPGKKMKGAKKRERRKQNGEGSSKPVPNINTSRSEKASPETARALPTIGKQTNIQTVKLKYVNKEMTPVKGRDEESKQKWYEKANKKAEDEMLRKQKEKEVLAAPGKKKKSFDNGASHANPSRPGRRNCW